MEIYNHTPRSGETGPPAQLWHASEDIWDRLLREQREERQRANWRTRFRRAKGNLRLGQKVWIWNTKTVTLKDKLEPWWVGPGLLEGKISGSIWHVRGPEGRVWICHADML